MEMDAENSSEIFSPYNTAPHTVLLV